MVERRITGEPTGEIITESITVETPDELAIENVEMTEDGGAIINPIEVAPEDKFDANLAEFLILNVQTKAGATDVFRITDQNGNMVATLSNRNQAETLINNNPNYRMERVSVPTDKNTTPSFAIKITEEMLEPYKTHKAKGGLVEMIDIFEVA